jgi:large subunit ribosomal protein L3
VSGSRDWLSYIQSKITRRKALERKRLMKAILGRKLGMTQVFKEDKLIPVTMVEAGPCVITKIETREKGVSYQMGYEDLKENKVTKPIKGYFAKVKISPKKHLVEFISDESFKVGQSFNCGIFAEGDNAKVTSVSKGKGFQGVVKRWGFAGGPAGHGSHFHRAPGSVGMAATPSRVLKGMKGPGQMGNKQVTVKNLEVIEVDLKNNRIYLKGAVPGGKGALVLIKSNNKIAEPKIEEIENIEEKTKENQETKVKSQEEVKEEIKKDTKVEQAPKEEVKVEEKNKQVKEVENAEQVGKAEEKVEEKEETKAEVAKPDESKEVEKKKEINETSVENNEPQPEEPKEDK